VEHDRVDGPQAAEVVRRGTVGRPSQAGVEAMPFLAGNVAFGRLARTGRAAGAFRGTPNPTTPAERPDGA
jgi:hypothetical protein